MKIINKNTNVITGNLVKTIQPKYSAFVVQVYDNVITILYGDELIAYQNIDHDAQDREIELVQAMDSAYRKAALFLTLNNPFCLSALYRHIVRHYTADSVKPTVWPSDKHYLRGIINMTTRANDIALPAISETELADSTEKEFTLCISRDGRLYTPDGTSFQIELANILTNLTVVGRPELTPNY